MDIQINIKVTSRANRKKAAWQQFIVEVQSAELIGSIESSREASTAADMACAHNDLDFRKTLN